MSNKPKARRKLPPPRRAPAPRSLPIFPVAIAAIVLVGVVAVVVTRLGGDDTGAERAGPQTAAVTVTGPHLPSFRKGEASDPAVGTAAPTAVGTSFDGTPVEVRPGSGPMLVLFAAHWCPHCQEEIPKLAGPFKQLPAGVGVVTVSTSVAKERGNFPPSRWFERESWPTPVLRDSEGSSVAEAYGLAGFPYFVLLDGAGKVAKRLDGEQGATTVMAELRALATPA